MKRSRIPRRRIKVPPGSREALAELHQEAAPAALRLGLKIFLVGGAVRDMVEGRVFSGEWDVVVFGGGDNGARDLAAEVSLARDGGKPVLFPRFGTCLVPGEYLTEYSQAHLRSTLTSLSPDPLKADALSRDFNLNALYIDLTGSEFAGTGKFEVSETGKRPVSETDNVVKSVMVLDPGGRGFEDLQKGWLRTPVPALRTFEDDPLRVFRAARLRACNGYKIHPSIGRAARKIMAMEPEISPERILDEMNRILLGEHPSSGLEVLGRWNAFESCMPEIQGIVGFKQNNPFHFPDLFRHSLRVVDRCPADLPLRWAALLHDCGKPATVVSSPNGDSYYGHEAAGAELSRQLLKRLKAGRKLTKEVVELISLHMVHYQDEWTDRAVRRIIQRTGVHLEKLLALVEADSASLRLKSYKLQDLKKLKGRIEVIRQSMPEPVSLLNGKQIMELLGVQQGLSVGRAKKALIRAVVNGDIPPDEEAARQYLLQWHEKTGSS